MQKLFLMTGLVLVMLQSSFCQSVQPVAAPSDVILELGTEGGGHQFYLGELIPLRYAYSAKVAGTYAWVSQSSKLDGGRPLEISCSPSNERVRAHPGQGDALVFEQILNAPCGGAGVGGSVGGCVDCDWNQPLTTTPLTFSAPLNMYVRIRNPGTYTCEASSGDVTTIPEEENQPALLVKSNPIVLTILDDPAWSHSAAISYAKKYETFCCDDVVAENHMSQCGDVARRITLLDTPDSLATEVKWFDGRNHRWDSGFWDAIRSSSQPQVALRLMASRIQEPDSEVSSGILEWLATSELRMETPDAFQSGNAATYHVEAVEKLRKYVRLLGSSLSAKNQNVLPESVKTYRSFAEQKYCEEGSLISPEEQNQILEGHDTRP